jgi:hypothetical protein
VLLVPLFGHSHGLPELRLANQERLRELVRDHGDTVDVFSAHDATELRRHQNRAADDPIA